MTLRQNDDKRTILFLAANPRDSKPLRLGQEQREIQTSLERSNYRDNFVLKPLAAMRTSDLRRGLLDTKPEIVHFCGHAGINGIVSEDEQGNTKLITKSALTSLFEHCSGHVKCVVLNACMTSEQADEIAKHVEFVVGMKDSIGDDAALEFTKGFYDALGAGESFEKCYLIGVNAIQLESIPQDSVPVLKKKALV